MTSSVDGLVSGLSTSTIISQLMQVEAAPQTKLKTKVQTAETAVASYQSVNAKLKAFKSAAETLNQLSTWRSTTAASSSATVTASTTSGLTNTEGSATFDVTSVARAQTTVIKVPTHTISTDYDGNGAFEDTQVPLTSSLTITVGKYDSNGNFTAAVPAKQVVLDLSANADGSANGIASKVNSSGLDVRAYVVNTADGQGVLQFTGTKTGEDFGFQVSGLDGVGLDANGDPGANPASTFAKNASLRVGSGDTGYDVTSATNTFTGLIPGVTINVTKEELGVTVNAKSDVAGIADKIKAMVDAMNATLSEVKTQTAYDSATRKASPLTGDFMVRNMTQTILSKVSSGLAKEYANPAFDSNLAPDPATNPETIPFGSLSQIGIKLTRDGLLEFNASDFVSAYQADPSKIQNATQAIAESFRDVADKQSVSVTAVITGRKNEIDAINDQISNWDVRLLARREALQKQYAALETSLGKLKNQSSWLSGQLAGLSG